MILLFIPVIFLSSLIPLENISQDDTLFLIINSFPIVIIVLLSTYFMTKYVEKREFKTIGLALHSNVRKEIFLGILIGFLMMSLVFFSQLIFGDVSVKLADFSLIILLANFIIYGTIFAIQSSGEEILFRGYLFQTLIEGANKIIAVFILSVLFGFVHFFNPNVSLFAAFNIALSGILFSIAYIRTRSLWLPCALHFSWNFCQGFIYSAPVSGVKIRTNLLIIENNMPEFLSGGNFGPEGGIIASIVFLGGIFYIALSKRFSFTEDLKTTLTESKKDNYENK